MTLSEQAALRDSWRRDAVEEFRSRATEPGCSIEQKACWQLMRVADRALFADLGDFAAEVERERDAERADLFRCMRDADEPTVEEMLAGEHERARKARLAQRALGIGRRTP